MTTNRFVREPLSRLPLLTVVLSWLVSGSIASAADRVRVQDPSKSGPVIYAGEIIDFAGSVLLIELKSSGRTEIPASQVQEIETYYTPLHREGLELYAAGDTEKAETAFAGALKEENRKWVQREIRAWLIRCGWRKNDMIGAGTRFLELVQSDPQTRHWSIAPLVWTTTSIGAPLRDQARRWMAESDPAARILGASLLLQDSASGEAARTMMDDLARNPQTPISGLARAQLWRVRLGAKALTEQELNAWRSHIEYLPLTLRAGPQFLLAKGYAGRKADRDAATEWLWLPLAYNDNETLSARATLEAALALRRVSAEADANQLLEEVAAKYPGLPEASEARSLRSASANSDSD